MAKDFEINALKDRITRLEEENKELLDRLDSNSQQEDTEKYRHLFDSSSDALFLIDNTTGNILEANKTAEILYGYTHNELLSLKNTDLSHQPEQTKKVTETGVPLVLERWHKKKDGTVFPVEITGSFFSYNKKSVHIASIRDISKRQQAIELLKINEKVFRSYFDLSLVGVAITKPSMEWIRVNSKLCDMLGFSNSELVTKTWGELTPEEDFRVEEVKFKRALSNKDFKNTQFIKRLVCKDGKTITVDIATTVHRKENGEIDYLISLIQDITKKIEVEKKLADSELRFRELVHLLPQTVFETDKNGFFTFVNKYAITEFGYSVDELNGKLTFFDTLIPEDKITVKQSLAEEIPKTGIGLQFSMLRKSGETFSGLVHFSSIYKNNEFDGFRGIITNIEDQKQIEQKLRESEENYRTIFELANDSIMIHDTETAIVLDANRNAIESYGLNTLKELQEYPFWTDQPPYSYNDVLYWIKKAVTDGPQTFEWLNRRIDGTFFWEEVHVSFAKILGENRIISISRNITARKKAEEKLELANKELKIRNEEYAALNEEYSTQNEELVIAKEKAVEADRLKSAFLANMSHEIRTPMNAIMGFSGLIDGQNITPEKRTLYSQIIKKRSADLLKIIDDILDISKIEANQLVITENPGNVNSMLNDLLDYFLNKREMENKQNLQISISSQLSDHDAHIIADFGRLKQILFNLTENALKFTDKGSIVISCLINDQNQLQFTVKDTGIGIDPKMHDLIFQRFSQANDQKSELVSGTGLGLAISKGLVELMGGNISVKSEPNFGAEFLFTIPYKMGMLIDDEINSPEHRFGNLENNTILIVEDDEVNIHFIKEVLEMAKANVLVADNGMNAVSMLKSYPIINAILLDIRLPDFNGLELIPKFQSINPKVKIIIQSAYATKDDIDAGFEAGCDAYLTKPTDAEKLVFTIIEKIKEVK